MGIPFIFSRYSGRRAYYRCAAHINCAVRLCLQEQEADDQVVASIDISKELPRSTVKKNDRRRGRNRPSHTNKRRKSGSSHHVRHIIVAYVMAAMIYDDIEKILRY